MLGQAVTLTLFLFLKGQQGQDVESSLHLLDEANFMLYNLFNMSRSVCNFTEATFNCAYWSGLRHILWFLKAAIRESGFSFLECPGSTDHRVVGLSGQHLTFGPSKPQTTIYSIKWKIQRPGKYSVILTWEKTSPLKYQQNDFENMYDFDNENLTLHIKSAKPQDSGLYKLEVTRESGIVCAMSFNVSVLDHVQKPQVWGQWKALDEGICQVTLSCLVSRDEDVSYTWYRGSEVIATQRNHTYIEEQMDVSGPHMYTCNVSNLVSWDSHTLDLTQSCLGDPWKSRTLLLLVIILILVVLFVGTLIGWCIWKKRMQSQTSLPSNLTVYEDVKDTQVKRNQKRNEVQKSPGEGITIYSMIELQSAASTSQETTKTLYSTIQHSRKKRNHSPSVSCTIYEEVGKQCPKVYYPARLSHKELEAFDIYP
ncbi:natural killer cell receptor 2B4 [Thomomys bottae]